MKKTIQEKGITLIALIISIIILLILAAVTINAITGDGIIVKAQQAAEDYKTKADEESTTLENYLAKLEDADQSSGSGSGTSGGTGTIQIGVKYTANTQLTDGNGDKFWVPSGYAVVLDENGKALVDKGVVITDAVDASGNSTGNEWVWIPATVSEISEVVDGKNVGKLYGFTSTGATARTYSAGGYHEVDVYSNSYDSDYDGKDESFKAQMQSEFDDMLESVEEYGGYYIARFEMGGTLENPVVKRYSEILNNWNWEKMYNATKKLAANDSVTTGMIWGCQWDNTCIWLVNSGNQTWDGLIDSTSWGNICADEWDDSKSKAVAGSNELWKAGNIYDLAGNVGEWTRLCEYYNEDGLFEGDYYVWRGACYGESNAKGVVEIDHMYYQHGNNSSRATLMINV